MIKDNSLTTCLDLIYVKKTEKALLEILKHLMFCKSNNSALRIDEFNSIIFKTCSLYLEISNFIKDNSNINISYITIDELINIDMLTDERKENFTKFINQNKEYFENLNKKVI